MPQSGNLTIAARLNDIRIRYIADIDPSSLIHKTGDYDIRHGASLSAAVVLFGADAETNDKAQKTVVVGMCDPRGRERC